MKKILIIIISVFFTQSSFGQQFTDLYGDYLGQTSRGDTPVVFAGGISSQNILENSAAVFFPTTMKYIVHPIQTKLIKFA